MLFTLEALHARHGDCLLLHYGTAAQPRLIVIDGGPAPTYVESLQPRLLALREVMGDPLPIELMVVSHVDDDHIDGLLALMAELRELKHAHLGLPFKIKELWHNSFDDVLAGTEIHDAIAFVNALPPTSAGVVAGIAGGRTLREDAEVLGIAINKGFGGLVARADDGGVVMPCAGGLTLTVLGPAREELEGFKKKWEAAHLAAKQGDGAAAATALDASPTNKSSIVFLAASGGKKILFTGDARGDLILQGLEASGDLPVGGTMHVDVLKLPHHGSEANVPLKLLQRVIADTYVVSANGSNSNPDVTTLERLAVAREGQGYTLVCTFPEHAYKAITEDTAAAKLRKAALQAFDAWATAQPSQVKIVYRDPAALGVTITLGDESLE